MAARPLPYDAVAVGLMYPNDPAEICALACAPAGACLVTMLTAAPRPPWFFMSNGPLPISIRSTSAKSTWNAAGSMLFGQAP